MSVSPIFFSLSRHKVLYSTYIVVPAPDVIIGWSLNRVDRAIGDKPDETFNGTFGLGAGFYKKPDK
jgi:hypothetical protein